MRAETAVFYSERSVARAPHIEKRALSREPSVELLKIEDQLVSGSLFEEDRGKLCTTATTNFVGSLLFALHQDEFLREYRDCSVNPRRSLVVPFEIRHNVPLYQHIKGARIPKTLSMTAKTVLVKRACGEEAGLVLDEELAGLIIEHSEYPNMPDRWYHTVGRVWNNMPLTLSEDDRAYEPVFMLPLPMTPFHKSFNEVMVPSLKAKFNTLYKKYVATYHPICALDALYHLASQLNRHWQIAAIPLPPKELFYYTDPS